MESLKKRIISSSIINNKGCWIWVKSTIPRGYGKIGLFDNSKAKNRTFLVHRVSYAIFNNLDIFDLDSKNQQIHHICREKLCVNPSHLIAMSKSDHDKMKDYQEIEMLLKLDKTNWNLKEGKLEKANDSSNNS